MMKVACIFPGQGAQYVGMGQEIQRNSRQAQEIFERANRILDFDLSKLIFNGPLDELSKTENCQPAVFTVSVACFYAFRAQKQDIEIKYMAGLSLGEYTALLAAEAVDFEPALKLVHKRAQYMEEAARANPGGMVSLIGLALEAVNKICRQAKVEIANLNCPGQLVISGSLSGLEKAKQLAQAAGAKRIIPLKVSGAFHSSLMAEAAEKLTQALKEVEIRRPKTAVVANVTAREESTPGEIKENLARQVSCRTRWEDSIRLMASSGIKHFLEIGPGKVLRGLLRKIDPELKVYNIETAEDIARWQAEAAR